MLSKLIVCPPRLRRAGRLYTHGWDLRQVGTADNPHFTEVRADGVRRALRLRQKLDGQHA
jgi:hypothetical protein